MALDDKRYKKPYNARCKARSDKSRFFLEGLC